jgi:XTP/dITP diphosphohydrolase
LQERVANPLHQYPTVARLIVADSDEAVVAACRAEFAASAIEILALSDVGLPEPRPSGRDAAEIAIRKAGIVAALAGYPAVTLASSFRIDPLRRDGGGGPQWRFAEPWPFSAAEFVSELAQVFNKLAAGGYVGPDDRGAYYHCLICLAWPTWGTRLFEATVDGQLTEWRIDKTASCFAHYFQPDGERVPLDRLDPGRQQAYSACTRAFRLLANAIA